MSTEPHSSSWLLTRHFYIRLAMLLSACTGLLVASAAFSSSSIAAADSPPTVTLPQGSVAGNYISKSTVSLPRPVAAYHAIPYVAPPIGDLRYRFPQPPLRWSGVLNATTYGPVCPQAAATPAWDESCLTIDIFTPPGTTTDSKLPVLLYIAGGEPISSANPLHLLAATELPSLLYRALHSRFGASPRHREYGFSGSEGLYWHHLQLPGELSSFPAF